MRAPWRNRGRKRYRDPIQATQRHIRLLRNVRRRAYTKRRFRGSQQHQREWAAYLNLHHNYNKELPTYTVNQKRPARGTPQCREKPGGCAAVEKPDQTGKRNLISFTIKVSGEPDDTAPAFKILLAVMRQKPSLPVHNQIPIKFFKQRTMETMPLLPSALLPQ